MSRTWLNSLETRYENALDLHVLCRYTECSRELDGLIGEFLMLSSKVSTLSIHKNPLPLDHICYRALVLYMQAQYELGVFDEIDSYLVRRFGSLVEMPIQLYNRWADIHLAHGDYARVLQVTDRLLKSNYDTLSSELYDGYMTILVAKGLLPAGTAVLSLNDGDISCIHALIVTLKEAVESVDRNNKLSPPVQQHLDTALRCCINQLYARAAAIEQRACSVAPTIATHPQLRASTLTPVDGAESTSTHPSLPLSTRILLAFKTFIQRIVSTTLSASKGFGLAICNGIISLLAKLQRNKRAVLLLLLLWLARARVRHMTAGAWAAVREVPMLGAVADAVAASVATRLQEGLEHVRAIGSVALSFGGSART